MKMRLQKLAAISVYSLPPCGGGLGRGEGRLASLTFPPSPALPRKGGERPRTIAVIDTGKTNAKVVLAKRDGAQLAMRTAPSVVLSDGPYPHFDVRRTWDFIEGALSELSRERPIDAIVTIAHGSAGAFIDDRSEGDGLVLPIIDYEFPGPDELEADYDAVRPPFSESFSPRLPGGLNLGAQYYWQFRRFPAEFAAASCYVNYPQYWSWRLSGVAATEMCSMGAHSDLWNPRALKWSSLVERMGWAAKMAPLRPAFDVLGPVRQELQRRLGLTDSVAVHCGLHDSSASLLPHIRTRQPPFTVVSTGTWVILFAVGGDIGKLDPERDTLANVSADGDPVPCGRFMGGREFEMLTGGQSAEPTSAEIGRVIGEKIMALPTFVEGVGPFPHARGRWSVDPATLSASERSAVASLYLALVTAESIATAGGGSAPVIVEGPFARNPLYCSALSAVGGYPVEPSDAGTGTTLGAVLLATGEPPPGMKRGSIAGPLAHPGLSSYIGDWKRAARA